MADVRERILIDGYELTEGLVRDVEVRDGLYQTAPLVGENGTVPNRSGEVWRPKRRGAGTFTVNIWFSGTDRTGAEAAFTEIIQAVGDGSRLPLWTRYLPNGTVREARGEVVGTLNPTPIGHIAMRAALEVRVPAGVWEGTVNAQAQTSMGPGAATVLEMTSFGNDISAPMERLTCRISGPATGAKVTDVTNDVDGDSFTYAGTIPAGATLTVNSETWAITGTSFTPDRAALTHTGPRFLTVRTPMPRRFPLVRFDYTNGGSTTQMTISGRPAYAI